MENKTNSASSNTKKMLAVFAMIAVMIVAAFFLFGSTRSEEELDPSQYENIKGSAFRVIRKGRPATGVYSENLLSDEEADAIITEGALAPEAVGDIESKKYNVYDETLDLELAGPEQEQETVDEDEVQQLIEEAVSTPEPSHEPEETATPEKPVVVDNTASEESKAAEEAARKAEEARLAAEEAAKKAEAEEAARLAEEARKAEEARLAAEAEARAAAEAEMRRLQQEEEARLAAEAAQRSR